MTRPDGVDDPAERAVAAVVDDLGRSLEGVEATDEAGRSLGFRAGMRRAVDLIVAQTAGGRKLMFIGNGASSAIASHQSVDYWKTGGMRAIAFNDAALLTCLGNDFGYPSVFEKPVAMFADAGDVLMAISSSGRSENIIRAVRAARDKACPVVTMSGFSPDNPLRHLGEVNFYVPSKSYGHVEVTHLSLSHCLLDTIVTLHGSHLRSAAPGGPD
jgi:D-sedoheptulose 7-phosphate isomerase